MKNIDTKCVQAGYQPQKSGDPRILPICQSTTYYYDKPEELASVFDLKTDNYMYSRISNPTVAAFEKKIADLEGGVGALATSSGQAAMLITVLNVCSTGDHIVASSNVYGGTYNLLDVTLRRMGIDTTFIDPDCSENELCAAIKDNTKIVFAETVSNPSVTVLDFDKFAKVCKKKDVLFVVDNTLATPCLCRPLELGANIVTHSTTKYIDGHAVTIGGIIVDGGTYTFQGSKRYPEFDRPDDSYHGIVYTKDCGNAAFITKARVQLMRDLGACQSAQNAFYCNLGTETLHLRMKRHSENALKIAQAVQGHKKIDWVKYPLLPGYQYYDLAKKYLPFGAGGMLSIGLSGGEDSAYQFIRNLKLLKLVTHVADSRSCLLHPASTTHRQLSDAALEACGVPKNLIRISAGIEDGEDIVNDILHALERI